MAAERCSGNMVKAHLKTHPPATYAIGETVYIRLPKRGLKGKSCIVEARVEKRNPKWHTYKVAFVSPKTGKRERKWVLVDG